MTDGFPAEAMWLHDGLIYDTSVSTASIYIGVASTTDIVTDYGNDIHYSSESTFH